MQNELQTLEWGKWEWLTEPSEVVVLAVGTMVQEALRAGELLRQQGIRLAVINARFVKPFDQDILSDILRRASVILTAEEGSVRGGFGQAIADYLLSHQYRGKFQVLGVPDDFITHGTRAELLGEIALEAEDIAQKVESLCNQVSVDIPASRVTNGSLLRKLGLRRNGNRKGKPEDKRASLTGTDSDK
jgi:1-deoxy-D-xylulose-5-phosphate synthase